MLEFLLLAVILSILFYQRSFRCWFIQVGVTEKQLGSMVILLMIIFHFLDFSRNSFPFVRWSMYTEKFESSEMRWAKIQARLQDGSLVDLNPTQQFPSLNRNFAERFHVLVKCAQQGELTELGQGVYTDLLEALGAQYNRAHSDNPAVELIAYLETTSVQNGKTHVQREAVTSYVLPDNSQSNGLISKALQP